MVLALSVIIGLGVCLGVPLVFGVVLWQVLRAQREVAKTAQAVKSGAVVDLLPWGPASLRELSRAWVGEATYTGGLVGKRDDASGRVPSVHSGDGWLLAFAMSSRDNDGLVQATSSAHRLELRVTADGCWATLNGAVLGTWRPLTGELRDPEGAPIGSFVRGTSGQLVLRGREVATLDPRVEFDSARPAQPTALFTHLAPALTAEDEAWALAVGVLELSWFGPRRYHGRSRARG